METFPPLDICTLTKQSNHQHGENCHAGTHNISTPSSTSMASLSHNAINRDLCLYVLYIYESDQERL